MKKIFFLTSGLILFFIVLYNFLPDKKSKVTAVNNDLQILFHSGKSEVKIGNDIFLTDIADDSKKRYNGLSGREELGSNEAMLFIFENPDRYGFWMKGMLFSIDIIWIKDNRIIGFSENLKPDNSFSPKLYYPSKPVDLVLEINAGQVHERGIKIGDIVDVQSY